MGPTKLSEAAAGSPGDAAERFRLARARQEEIKLAKMRGTVERVAVVKPRLFHLSRGDRDRLLAWVSRTAPLIAAEVHVDEGATWRGLQRAVSTLLDRLAAIKMPVEDPGHAEPRAQVERNATPVPRDAATRFQLARARQEEHKLRKMQRDHVDLGAATSRAVAFRRRMLDELAGWVPRVAPTIAAEVGAEVAPLAHAMARHLGPLQTDLATIDVAAALRTDLPEEGDDGEGETHEHDETETGDCGVTRPGPRATAPPRRSASKGPRRRHRRRLPGGHRARARGRRR